MPAGTAPPVRPSVRPSVRTRTHPRERQVRANRSRHTVALAEQTEQTEQTAAEHLAGRPPPCQRGMTEKRNRFRIMYQTSRISTVCAVKPIQPLYQSTPGMDAMARAKKTCQTNT